MDVMVSQIAAFTVTKNEINALNNFRHKNHVGLTPSAPTKTYLSRVSSNAILGGRNAIGVRGLGSREESESAVILAILLRESSGLRCTGVAITLEGNISFPRDHRAGFMIGSLKHRPKIKYHAYFKRELSNQRRTLSVRPLLSNLSANPGIGNGRCFEAEA